jgi:hypothetical protein
MNIIIIAYFSPCHYRTPLNNLFNTIKILLKDKLPVSVIEAVMPGSYELKLPDNIIHQKIYTKFNSYMFLKENLYNIAAKNLYQYDNLIFMDSDIYFDNDEWFNETNRLLENYDIIQPFDKCTWLNKDGITPKLTKSSAAKCLNHASNPNNIMYHPGFCWAMKRQFFDNIGGWYEKHPLGGGDKSMWFALDKNVPLDIGIDSWAGIKGVFIDTIEYQQYREHIRKLSYKVGYSIKNNIYHKYHGQIKNRSYLKRYEPLSSFKNKNYPMQKNEEGLLEWEDNELNKLCYQYFKNRQEDL